MISHIQGKILVLNAAEGSASIMTSGIGYLVNIGQGNTNRLQIGVEISLFIETIVKENGITLFGFDSYEKLIWFRSLLKVTGVGPKVAIGVIDGIHVQEIINSIINNKPQVLQKVSGLGEKVSQRIVAELQKEPAKNAKIFGSTQVFNGRIISIAPQPEHQSEIPQPEDPAGINAADVTSALVNLGFDYNRSFSVACSVVKTAQNLEEAIIEALKQINS